MKNSPVNLFRLFPVLVLLGQVELNAAGADNHDAALRNAEQEILQNLSRSDGSAPEIIERRREPRRFFQRLIKTFSPKTGPPKPETDLVNTTPKPTGLPEQRAAQRLEFPPETIVKPEAYAAEATKKRRPSRLASLVSRVLVRLGLEERESQNSSEALLARSKSDQKWLRLLRSQGREESATSITALSIPPSSGGTVSNEGKRRSWIAGVFGSSKENHSEQPNESKVNAGVLGFLQTQSDREMEPSVGRDSTRPNSFSSEQNRESQYLAVNRNRAPIHLIDPGTDSTIPLEIDGGRVGRLHAHGDEWSWVQLDSGLMGVMRNRYLREARREEVANFLVDERVVSNRDDSSAKLVSAEFGSTVSELGSLSATISDREALPRIEGEGVLSLGEVLPE